MRSWPEILLSEGISSIQSILSIYWDLIPRKGGRGGVETGANTKLRGWNMSHPCSPTSFCLLMAVPERRNILRAPKVIFFGCKTFHPSDSPFSPPPSFRYWLKWNCDERNSERKEERKCLKEESFVSITIFIMIISHFYANDIRFLRNFDFDFTLKKKKESAVRINFREIKGDKSKRSRARIKRRPLDPIEFSRLISSRVHLRS